MKYLLPGLAAALCAFALTACGGGGGGGAPLLSGTPSPSSRASDIPASATASVSGLIAYMKQIAGTRSDTSEPLFVGNAVLPTDDTAEPTN